MGIQPEHLNGNRTVTFSNIFIDRYKEKIANEVLFIMTQIPIVNGLNPGVIS